MDTELDVRDLVQRTATGADLLDAANLIADVAEAVYGDRADPDQPYTIAVLRQLTGLLEACAAKTHDPQQASELATLAAHLVKASHHVQPPPQGPRP
ncbi:hypothetical protein ABZX56_30525 [Streptomyces parvulus]|uniref:hypothetical protein n=1 Tax=Streptomyces parvulus TaxID=146923 RepID=UPI0033BA5510